MGDISNSHSVKMEDHFKSNIQLLPNKNQQNNVAGVYSVLPPSSQQVQQTHQQYTSLYANNGNNDVLSGTRLRIDDNSSNNTQNLNYAVNLSHRANNSNAPFNSNTQQLATPHLFSASLNSSNLLATNNPDDKHSMEGNQSNQQQYGRQVLPMVLGMSSASVETSSIASQSVQANSMSYTQSSTGLQYPQASSGIQYSTSAGYQVAGGNLVALDGQPGSQPPTYVLLQAGGDTGGQPQMFLAMHTPGIPGQDGQQQHQPYVTLQPVSVDGNDLSNNGMVQESLNLQQVVMGSTNDMNAENKSITNDSGQVVLSIPGQQALLPPQSNNGQPLVTYLQTVGTIGVPVSGIDQNQVIMAAGDLSGNLTLHNVTGLSGKRNILSAGRPPSQVGVTPRRRLSTDPRSCEQCGRGFKYPSDLKKHLQIHTDIKKFECDECPRTFRRLHQLNVHKRIHTGEKPYVCNRCGAQFRHDSTLTMHIRTRHDHLKPFTCDGCGKKFGRMSHLRKHQRNVCGRNGVRAANVQCKYCDMQFPKKADLKTHFIVCEKKPESIDKELNSPATFLCDCGKEFTRVYDFKRHQLSHSDEKPYGCPQCGKMFKERSSLNKHVKRMHCSEGDGTIPIDDEGVIGDDDDDEELSGDEREITTSDMIVSLSMTGNSGTHARTATVTAQTLAQAGIITSSDGRMMSSNGEPLTAAEILNFPEVVEALGLSSNVHATVLDADENSTMIAITQPPTGELETSEVPMDMEQSIIQDGNLIDNSSDTYIPSSDALGMPSTVETGVDDNADDIPVIYNTDNAGSQIYNSSENETYESSLDTNMVTGSLDTNMVTSSLDANMVFKQEDSEEYIKHVGAQLKPVEEFPEEQQSATYTPSQMLNENSGDDNLVLDSV